MVDNIRQSMDNNCNANILGCIMFLREKKINKYGTTYTYLNLVESVREKGRIKQNIVVNFGNINNWTPEKLKKLSEDIAMYAGETATKGLTEDRVIRRLHLTMDHFY